MIPPYQAKIFTFDIGMDHGFHTATCRERRDLSCAARNEKILAERVHRIMIKRVRIRGEKTLAIKVGNPQVMNAPLVMAALSIPFMRQRLGMT